MSKILTNQKHGLQHLTDALLATGFEDEHFVEQMLTLMRELTEQLSSPHKSEYIVLIDLARSQPEVARYWVDDLELRLRND